MSIFDRIFQKKQKKSKQKRAESPMGNPAVLLGRQLADSLREKIPDAAALPEIVTYFEEMCRIPVENVEIQDDLITCITDPFGEEPEWIHFALTRQFPDGEGGLVEILLDIGFPDVKGRLQLEDELCSDELDERENVFDYIRRSAAYTALADTPPMAVDITCECT